MSAALVRDRAGDDVAAAERGAALLQHRLPAQQRLELALDLLLVEQLPAGDAVDLIGPSCDVDRVAAQAGTIGYEMLTRLGRRFARVHRHGVDSEPTCRARRAEERTIAG